MIIVGVYEWIDIYYTAVPMIVGSSFSPFLPWYPTTVISLSCSFARLVRTSFAVSPSCVLISSYKNSNLSPKYVNLVVFCSRMYSIYKLYGRYSSLIWHHADATDNLSISLRRPLQTESRACSEAGDPSWQTIYFMGLVADGSL